MPVRLENPLWRFKSPGPIKKDVAVEFEKLIMAIAEQGDFQRVIEHFKDRFSYGQSTMWSSSSSWSVCDMQRYMETAAGNAPRFVAAFVDGCESQAASGKDVPDIDMINEILATHEAGYQVIGGTVVSTAEFAEEQVSGSAVAFEPPIHPVSSAVKPDTFPNYASVAKANEPMALKAFLCHASGDKPRVKDLYHALKRDGFAPWLDAINLLPGQDWEAVITAEVRASHVVIVCLSRTAVTKAGFAQKEIKMAIDVADRQPQGTIFIIPARLEECEVPDRLSKLHWVNLYEEEGYQKLVAALNERSRNIR